MDVKQSIENREVGGRKKNLAEYYNHEVLFSSPPALSRTSRTQNNGQEKPDRLQMKRARQNRKLAMQFQPPAACWGGSARAAADLDAIT